MTRGPFQLNICRRRIVATPGAWETFTPVVRAFKISLAPRSWEKFTNWMNTLEGGTAWLWMGGSVISLKLSRSVLKAYPGCSGPSKIFRPKITTMKVRRICKRVWRRRPAVAHGEYQCQMSIDFKALNRHQMEQLCSICFFLLRKQMFHTNVIDGGVS